MDSHRKRQPAAEDRRHFRYEPVASGQPVNGEVSFVAPSFEPFGAIGRLSAIGDTNGSTLAQLESEVNKLKQALRDYGVLSL